MAINPIFINTRPAHRSDTIRAMRGVAVVDLPLLEINDLPLHASDADKLHGWQAGSYHALIITSVESAKRALAYLGDIIKPSTPMIAVGDATAKCLTNAGFTPILPVTANNEGMLALPQISSLGAEDKVLIWRGVGGRKLLHNTLIARGVQVDVIRWYERTRPTLLDEQFAKLLPTLQHTPADTPICVLISSQMAFEHWQSLPHDTLDVAHRYHYLALGERLTHLVQTTYPKACVHLLDDLSKEHIEQVLHHLHQ